MTSTEVLQQRLSEAETALHKLVTGARTASVSYDGHTVTYTAAKTDELRSYIRELNAQLNGKRGGSRRIIF